MEEPKVKKKGGGPIGNKHAVGNKGGGPIGNQNAKGHGCGRPPKPEYSDEWIEALGKEMIEQINKNPDWLFIQEFAIYKQMTCDLLWSFRERVNFGQYYKLAKHILGTRIAKGAGKDSGLNAGIAQRFLGCYFKDVKDLDLEMIDAKKQKNIEETVAAYQVMTRGPIEKDDNSHN